MVKEALVMDDGAPRLRATAAHPFFLTTCRTEKKTSHATK